MLRILFLIVLFSNLLFSETIIFRNGTVKKGTIISQDKTSVAFEEKEGSPPVIYSKKEIMKISVNDLSKDEIKKTIIDNGGADLLKDVTPSVPVTPKEGVYSSKGFLASKVPPRRWGAFWRSALVPGWGQLHQNRPVIGTTFFFLFLASGGFTFYQNRESGTAQNDYAYSEKKYIFNLLLTNDRTAQLLAQKDLANERTDMDKAGNRAQIAAGVLAGVYILNLVDVVIFHPRQEFSLNATFQRDMLALKFEYRF